MEFDRTCAKCRKHMEATSIAGNIPDFGDVCNNCWKIYNGGLDGKYV